MMYDIEGAVPRKTLRFERLYDNVIALHRCIALGPRIMLVPMVPIAEMLQS